MVNRCVCKEVPFWCIAALAKQGKSYAQISNETGCCKGCGTCEPYVRVVIKTHAHALPVMNPAEQARVMHQARVEDEAKPREDDDNAPPARQ